MFGQFFKLEMSGSKKKLFSVFKSRAREGLYHQELHDKVLLNVHVLHIEALEDRSTFHLVKI